MLDFLQTSSGSIVFAVLFVLMLRMHAGHRGHAGHGDDPAPARTGAREAADDELAATTRSHTRHGGGCH